MLTCGEPLISEDSKGPSDCESVLGDPISTRAMIASL